jgi:amino-acid N-acetyltransferase
LAGYAGLEGAGPDRLLRSVVVVPERRGEGFGSRILDELESRAQK